MVMELRCRITKTEKDSAESTLSILCRSQSFSSLAFGAWRFATSGKVTLMIYRTFIEALCVSPV